MYYRHHLRSCKIIRRANFCFLLFILVILKHGTENFRVCAPGLLYSMGGILDKCAVGVSHSSIWSVKS